MDILRTQGKGQIDCLSTKEARQVYNWNKQVATCYQRSRSFVRLKIDRHGIVYGRLDPEHNVEDLVARWFLSRFPMFTVLIESKRGTWIISKDSGLIKTDKSSEEIMLELKKHLPISPILKDLEGFDEDEYWQKYYDSQFIKTRKNRRYFLHNIPKKYHTLGGLKLEKQRFDKNKTLFDF